METVFQIWYLINNSKKYPQGHVFTSTETAKDLKSAEEKFKIWFKNNNWDTKWLRIKDYKNNKEITY